MLDMGRKNKDSKTFLLAEDNIFYIDCKGFVVIMKTNIKIETKQNFFAVWMKWKIKIA